MAREWLGARVERLLSRSARNYWTSFPQKYACFISTESIPKWHSRRFRPVKGKDIVAQTYPSRSKASHLGSDNFHCSRRQWVSIKTAPWYLTFCPITAFRQARHQLRHGHAQKLRLLFVLLGNHNRSYGLVTLNGISVVCHEKDLVLEKVDRGSDFWEKSRSCLWHSGSPLDIHCPLILRWQWIDWPDYS